VWFVLKATRSHRELVQLPLERPVGLTRAREARIGRLIVENFVENSLRVAWLLGILLFAPFCTFSPEARMAQKEPSTGPSRVRAAWYVLMGQRVTPVQMEAEWLEYQLIFDDILTRLSAQLARVSKNERERIKRELSDVGDPPARNVPATGPRRKDVVRARISAARGFPARGFPLRGFPEFKGRLKSENGSTEKEVEP